MVGENEDDTALKTMNARQKQIYMRDLKKAQAEINQWSRKIQPPKILTITEKAQQSYLDDAKKPMSYSKVKNFDKEIEFTVNEMFWQKYVPAHQRKPDFESSFVEKFPNPYYSQLVD